MESSETTITAWDDDARLWEHTWRRDAPLSEAGLQGPLLLGAEHVIYGFGAHAVVMRAASGVVERRVYLPGSLTRLQVEGDRARVEVQGEPDATGATWTRTYQVSATADNAPLVLNTHWRRAHAMLRDAGLVLTDAAAASGAPRPQLNPLDWYREPAHRARYEATLPVLAREAAQDPTNPWLHFWRGAYLKELDRGDEARSAFEAALRVEGDSRVELVRMANALDRIGEAALADAAFTRGMKALTEAGYEPELTSGLLGTMLYLGPMAKEGEEPTLAQLERRAERIWRFSPGTERVSTLYGGLAEALDDAGRGEDAARWRARAAVAEATPSAQLFGLARPAGQVLNVLLAFIAAFFLWFIVRALMTLKAARRGRERRLRWLPTAWWGRGAVVGWLLLVPVIVVAGVWLQRTVWTVGEVAGAPLEVLSGSVGHPGVDAFWAEAEATPEVLLIRGLSAHREGRLDDAAALYTRSGLPEAKVNLGVLAQERGEAEDARALYERALSHKPGLAVAAFNLGRDGATSPRVAHARELGAEGPLVALPDAAAWRAAWSARVPPWGGETLLGLGQGEDDTEVWWTGALLMVLVGLGLLGLATPRRREAKVDERSPITIAFSALCPGAHPRYGALGPWVLALALLSGWVAFMLSESGGLYTNVLEAIALPSYETVYGLAAEPAPSADPLRALQHAWWVLGLVNVAVVVAFARRAALKPTK